jgi:hypothetical protein
MPSIESSCARAHQRSVSAMSSPQARGGERSGHNDCGAWSRVDEAARCAQHVSVGIVRVRVRVRGVRGVSIKDGSGIRHLHVDEEAGRHLRARRSGVEERRAGVGEELLRHEVVRLDGRRDVPLVDADRHAHEQVLWALDHLAVDLEQVGALESLRAAEVSVIFKATSR